MRIFNKYLNAPRWGVGWGEGGAFLPRTLIIILEINTLALASDVSVNIFMTEFYLTPSSKNRLGWNDWKNRLKIYLSNTDQHFQSPATWNKIVQRFVNIYWKVLKLELKATYFSGRKSLSANMVEFFKCFCI